MDNGYLSAAQKRAMKMPQQAQPFARLNSAEDRCRPGFRRKSGLKRSSCNLVQEPFGFEFRDARR